jgi:hypothetical protein
MRSAAALLVTLSLLSCAGQDSAKKPSKPPPPPPPDDVIAIASVRSVTDATARLQKYVEAVQPGAGAAVSVPAVTTLLAGAVQATSIEGLALDRPVHVIILDPKKYARPVLLLGHARPATLRPGNAVAVREQGGAALLGEKQAVERCARWALGTLVAERAPESLTVRASLRKLVATYGRDIAQARSSMRESMKGVGAGIAKVLDLEIDLLLRLASQTEEMRLVVDASPTEAWAELQFTPTRGSKFETFNKAQRPASSALLARLVGTRSALLMAGHYEMGPLRGLMFELAGGMVASWSGTTADAAFRKRWDALFDHFTGPMAMAMSPGLGPTAGQQLFSVDDGPKTVAAMKAVVPWDRPLAIDVLGMMKVHVTPRLAAHTHAGISIDEMKIRFDMSSLAPEQQAILEKTYGQETTMLIAGLDRHVAMVWGPSAPESMKRVIDAVRSGNARAALPPGGDAAFAAAARRRSSYVMFMNLADSIAAVTGRTAQASSGLTMELGFPAGTAAVRFGLPAAHVRDLQAGLAR